MTALRVTIDGVVATVPLQRTCSDAERGRQPPARCADDPLDFDPANGYSAVARIG